MGLFQDNKNQLLEITEDVVNKICRLDEKTRNALSVDDISAMFCDMLNDDVDVNDLKQSMWNDIDSVSEQIYNGILYYNDPDKKEDINQHVLESRTRKKGEENQNYIPMMEVPIIPSSVERQALYGMLNDPYSCMMLSEQEEQCVRSIIENTCKENGDLWEDVDNLYWSFKEQHLYDSKDIREQLKLLKKAELEDRCVLLKLQGGEVEVMPYRLIYSPRKSGLFLLAVEGDEVRKFYLKDIDNVELLDRKIDVDIDKIISEQQRTLELEVLSCTEVKRDKITDANKRQYDRLRENVLERCFSVFSHLNKEAKYDQETDEHHISVTYYAFDEEEITKDVLALGEYVVVKSPESIIERIKAIL